ncbi:hypothetical protein BGZ74_002553, partial [Mortierella antarctica]
MSDSSPASVPASAPAPSILETLLKGSCPDPFNGRFRDAHAEDWLARFERFCNLAKVDDTGQDRILYTGILMTDAASRWYDQLGTITEATINGQMLSPYQVFQYKFRQRFVNVNDAEDAFDQLQDLRQKRSVNEYVTLFERYHNRLNNFDDIDAIHFFHGGLKPEIRQLVNNHPDIAADDINGLIALTEQETFLQPMDLDSVRAQSGAQTQPQRSTSKED